MQQNGRRGKNNPLWILGAVGAFILTQAKLLIPLLKFGKVGGAVISMFVSVGAYALIAPLPFAIGMVVMLLVHEMGHVVAAKQKGLPVTAPVFIPFMGALITMKKHPTDAITEAYIGLGGPILGTVGATVALAAATWLESPLLVSIAYIGFFLNLINLLPIHPLDGGRISTAITRWLWLVGLIGGLIVIIYLKSILFFIIWVTFAWDMYKKFVKHRNKAELITSAQRYDFHADHLLQQGFIPGVEHKRELPFTTYSDLQGETQGVQTIEMAWEGIGFKGRLQLARQSLIQRVHVIKVDHLRKADGFYLGILINVEYTVYENDAYYDVPVATRWKFGAVYFALAIFLFAMIRLVHQMKYLY